MHARLEGAEHPEEVAAKCETASEPCPKPKDPVCADYLSCTVDWALVLPVRGGLL